METNQMLRELNACAALCNICYQSCLEEEDLTNLRRCIELTRDCADICMLGASFFARSSAGLIPVLKQCIEICDSCAEECRKHDYDHCLKCGHVCNTCAEICRAYISRHYEIYM